MFSRRRRTPFSRFIPPPPSGPSSGSGMPQSAPGRTPRGGGVPGRRPQVRPFPSPRRGSGPAPPAGGGPAGDEEPRLGGRPHRDHRPLPHPPAQLVRVLPRPPLRVRHLHPPQPVHGPRGGPRPPAGAMGGEYLGDLVSDGENGGGG